MVAWLSRRSMFAGSLSLSLHGALVVLAIVLFGLHAAHAPSIALVPIEVVVPDPPIRPGLPGPSGQDTRAGAGDTAKAGAIGRRGVDPPKRSMTKAPPVRDPYADVVIGFDAPDRADPGTANGSALGISVGGGLSGIGAADGAGFGELGDGLGIPAPPVSHARPPRPRREYSHEQLSKIRRYAGQKIMVGLMIDARGVVTKVGLLEGIEPAIDRRAIELARSFEFYPALRDDGSPRASSFRWDFVIEEPPPDALTSDSVDSLMWQQQVRMQGR